MYNVYVTKLKNVRKHPNADRLMLADVFDTTVIVGNDMTEGQVVIYFPTDGQLSEEYATVNNLLRQKDEYGNNVGGYLDPAKRNIRTMRLRGELSDGLVMPLNSLASFGNVEELNVGDTVETFNGKSIAVKYIPRTNKSQNASKKQDSKKKKIRLRSYAEVGVPDFKEHKDTKQYSYNKHNIKEGALIYLTLKMHGTSGRTGLLPKETKKINPVLTKLGFKPKTTRVYDYVTGTRRVVLKNLDDNSGYYDDNSFRKEHHDKFVGKLKQGETVYYEIVGYTKSGTPIMNEVKNSKLGKDFVKKYGKSTTYTYGCEAGESDIYIYRMTMTTPEGAVIEYPQALVERRAEEMGLKTVPVLDKLIFTTVEDLDSRVFRLVEGPDPIDPTHIREGVVIRVEGADIYAYKHKSNDFKILEGIMKESATAPDMEEAQEDYNYTD